MMLIETNRTRLGMRRSKIRNRPPQPRPSPARVLVWATLLVVLQVLNTTAATLKIDLPLERETFPPGAGSELANAQCLICHSADYVKIQPSLSRAFWKASVQKMQQKYGAEIPVDQVEPLASYLAKTFGVEQSASTATASNTENSISKTKPKAAVDTGETADGPSLAGKFGCLGCHAREKKIVGPAFKDIAKKYDGRADALEKITNQITRGGGGAWGPVPMPPFPQIPATDVAALSRWITQSGQATRRN